MFKIGDKVYYVNDLGYTSETLYSILNITNSKFILQTEFTGKRSKLRKFQHHIDKHLTSKVLFYDLKQAREFSIERKNFISSGVLPCSIGDEIAWNNYRYKGKIINIEKNSYIVSTPNREWSISPFLLDVVKIN